MVTTAEWLEEVRARPSAKKRGRPKGTPNPPAPPKLPRPQPIERGRRLAPDVVTSDDPWLEVADPVEGLRYILIEGGSMGDAARKGLQNAREFWRWLDVQSVAGIEPAGTGWRVTVRILEDCNPLLRRRWRMDWYQ